MIDEEIKTNDYPNEWVDKATEIEWNATLPHHEFQPDSMLASVIRESIVRTLDAVVPLVRANTEARIHTELRELWRKPPQYQEWSAIARICGRDELGRAADREDRP